MRFATLAICVLAVATSQVSAAEEGFFKSLKNALFNKKPTVECARVIDTYTKTVQAFTTLREAEISAAYASMSQEPTHTELLNAARLKISKVEELVQKVKESNELDTKLTRRWFIERRLFYIGTITNVVKGLTNNRVTKHDFLGKVVQGWEKFKSKLHLPSHKFTESDLPPRHRSVADTLWRFQLSVDKKLRNIVDNQCHA